MSTASFRMARIIPKEDEMKARSTRSGYNSSQIVLHWAIAAMVVFNYLFSEGMGKALRIVSTSSAEALPLLPQVHVWTGILVLALVALRLFLRITVGVPQSPTSRGAIVAAAAHKALYLLLFAVPVLGASAWFGRNDFLGDVHSVAANLLVVLAAGHGLAAIVHHFVFRDGLLWKMLKPHAWP